MNKRTNYGRKLIRILVPLATCAFISIVPISIRAVYNNLRSTTARTFSGNTASTAATLAGAMSTSATSVLPSVTSTADLSTVTSRAITTKQGPCSDSSYEIFNGTCYKVFEAIDVGPPSSNQSVYPINSQSCGGNAQAARAETQELNDRVYAYIKTKEPGYYLINCFNLNKDFNSPDNWKIIDKYGQYDVLDTSRWTHIPGRNPVYLDTNVMISNMGSSSNWISFTTYMNEGNLLDFLVCQLYE